MKNIHLLPTKKPSRLFMSFGKLNYGDYITKRKDSDIQNQHIYITSDEEIKEMDWFYNIKRPDTPINRKFINTIIDENCKKIILTDRIILIENGVQAIDDEFLEWFVKNPSCEEVEIEKFHGINTSIAEVSSISGNDDYNWQGKGDFRDYKIIIPKEEPKQEKLEEVAEKYSKKSSASVFQENHKKDFIAGAKFQNEQIIDFLHSEITERRDYSASKMCEKVIEFIEQFENK